MAVVAGVKMGVMGVQSLQERADSLHDVLNMVWGQYRTINCIFMFFSSSLIYFIAVKKLHAYRAILYRISVFCYRSEINYTQLLSSINVLSTDYISTFKSHLFLTTLLIIIILHFIQTQYYYIHV